MREYPPRFVLRMGKWIEPHIPRKQPLSAG